MPRVCTFYPFLFAAALILGAAATACDAQGDDDAVEPGEVIEAGGPSVVTGTETKVRVPTGQLTITVGNPVSEVDPTETADVTARSASSGDSLVGVVLEWDGGKSVPDWQEPLLPPGTIDPVVTVVAGNHRTEVDAPMLPLAAAYFVGVEGGAEPAIEIEFDGVTQTVDATGKRDAGDAAGLYDEATAAAPAETRCDTERLEGGVTADMTCAWGVGAMAYVVDAGWAPHAGVWTVASIRSSYDSLTVTADGESPSYTVTGVDDASTLAGKRASGMVIRSDRTDGFDGALVFEPFISEADLEIVQRLDSAIRSGDSGPETKDFVFRRTVTVGG
ncbi:hypothetical protein [Nocardioides speluncae]|uniref:hypothetical protein n=1 Tax=Nocardioides speluncae TaxID=2670337 RepID=UPI000D69AC07|nr:hypothetical protein [Nocardioides speluncae]